MLSFLVTTAFAQRTWDGGGTDNNWNTAANWSPDGVPAAGEAVTFDGTSVKNCNINVVVNVGNFTIAPGYTGTITQTQTATASSFTQSGGRFIQTAGLNVSGNFSVTGGPLPVSNFSTSGGSTFALTVGGDMTFTDTHNFTHNGVTVSLDGGGVHNITGNANFHTLEAATAADVIALGAGQTFGVANLLALQSVSCTATSLTSTAPPTRATLNLGFNQTFSDVRIDNINVTGSTLTINSHKHLNNAGNVTANTPGRYYWVGGGGDWNDPTSWSFTDGGTPQGATGCVPTTAEDVFFTANSGTGTVNVTPASVARHMFWQNPGAIDLNLSNDLSLYGSLNPTPPVGTNSGGAITFSGAADLAFVGTAAATVTTLGIDLGNTRVGEAANAKTLTLQSTFSPEELKLVHGLLRGNAQDINVVTFNARSDYPRTLDLATGGRSDLVIIGTGNAFDINDAGLVPGVEEATIHYHADSEIRFTNNSTDNINMLVGTTDKTLPHLFITYNTGTFTVDAVDAGNATISFGNVAKLRAGGSFVMSENNKRFDIRGNFIVNSTTANPTTVTYRSRNNSLAELHDVSILRGANVAFHGNQLQFNGDISLQEGTTTTFHSENHDFFGDFTLRSGGGGFASTLTFANTNTANNDFRGNFTVDGTYATVNFNSKHRFRGDFTATGNGNTFNFNVIALGVPAVNTRLDGDINISGTGTRVNVAARGLNLLGAGSFQLPDVYLQGNTARLRILRNNSGTVRNISMATNTMVILPSGQTTTIRSIDPAVGLVGPCPALTGTQRLVLRSSTPGTQATANFQTAQTWYHMNVTDINATNVIPVNVYNGLDGGNNTNIRFNPSPATPSRTLYWVGGTGDWNDCSHWATTSGGTGGVFPPTPYDNVIFDGNSFSAAGQRVNITPNASARNFTWRPATQAGAGINMAQELFIYQDFRLNRNDVSFTGSSSLNFSSYTGGNPRAVNSRQSAVNSGGSIMPTLNFGKRNTTFGQDNGGAQVGANPTRVLLDDDIEINGGILLTEGRFDTNGQVVEAVYLDGTSSNLARAIVLTNTDFTLTGTNTDNPSGQGVLDLRGSSTTAAPDAANVDARLIENDATVTSTINFTHAGNIAVEAGVQPKTMPHLNFLNSTGQININTGRASEAGSGTVTFGNLTKAAAGGQFRINEPHYHADKNVVRIGNINVASTAANSTRVLIEMNDTNANRVASLTVGDNATLQYWGRETIFTGNVTFGDNVNFGTWSGYNQWRDGVTIQGDFTAGDNFRARFSVNETPMTFQGNVTIGNNPAVTFHRGVTTTDANSTMTIGTGGQVDFNPLGGTSHFHGQFIKQNGGAVYFRRDTQFEQVVSLEGNAHFSPGGNYIFHGKNVDNLNSGYNAALYSSGLMEFGDGATVEFRGPNNGSTSVLTNVVFRGNSSARFLPLAGSTLAPNYTFRGNLTIEPGTATIHFSHRIDWAEFQQDIIIGEGRRLEVSTSAFNINGHLRSYSKCPSALITLASSDPPNQADVRFENHRPTLVRFRIENISTSNGNHGADVYRGEDGGNNTGFAFDGYDGGGTFTPRTLYWVGTAANKNWNEYDNSRALATAAPYASNWSATSGGPGGECIPTIFDNVMFDNGSGSGNVVLDAIAGNKYDAEARNFTYTKTTGPPLTFGATADYNMIVTGNMDISTNNIVLNASGTSNGSLTFSAIRGTESSTISLPANVVFPNTAFDGHAVMDQMTSGYLSVHDKLLNTTPAPPNTGHAIPNPANYSFTMQSNLQVSNRATTFFVNGDFNLAGHTMSTGGFDMNETVSSGEVRVIDLTGVVNVTGVNTYNTRTAIGPKGYTLAGGGYAANALTADFRGAGSHLDLRARETHFRFTQPNVGGTPTTVLMGNSMPFSRGGVFTFPYDLSPGPAAGINYFDHRLGDMTLTADNVHVRLLNTQSGADHAIGHVRLEGANNRFIMDDAPADINAVQTLGSLTTTNGTNTLVAINSSVVFGDGQFTTAGGNQTPEHLDPSGTAYSGNINLADGTRFRFNDVPSSSDPPTMIVNGTTTLGSDVHFEISPWNAIARFRRDVESANNTTYRLSGTNHFFDGNLTTGNDNYFDIANTRSRNIFGDALGHNAGGDRVDFGPGIRGVLQGRNNEFNSAVNIHRSGATAPGGFFFHNSNFRSYFDFGYDRNRNVVGGLVNPPAAGAIGFESSPPDATASIRGSTDFKYFTRFGHGTNVTFSGESTDFVAPDDTDPLYSNAVRMSPNRDWPAMAPYSGSPSLAQSRYYPHNQHIDGKNLVMLQFGPRSVIRFQGERVRMLRGDAYFIGSEVPYITKPATNVSDINIQAPILCTERFSHWGQKTTFGDDLRVRFLDGAGHAALPGNTSGYTDPANAANFLRNDQIDDVDLETFKQVFVNVGTHLYFEADGLNVTFDHLRLSRRNEVQLSRNGRLNITGDPWGSDTDADRAEGCTGWLCGLRRRINLLKVAAYDGVNDGTGGSRIATEPVNAGGFTARTGCDSWLTVKAYENTASPIANHLATIRFVPRTRRVSGSWWYYQNFHRWQNVEMANVRVTHNNSLTGTPPRWNKGGFFADRGLRSGAMLRVDGAVNFHDVYAVTNNVTLFGGVARPDATIWDANPASSDVFYWIGNSGQPDPNLTTVAPSGTATYVTSRNWTNPWNWSTTSGGLPQKCVPNGGDIVVFDRHSFGSVTSVNRPVGGFYNWGAVTPANPALFINPRAAGTTDTHQVVVDDDRIRIGGMEWIDNVGAGATERRFLPQGVDYTGGVGGGNGAMDTKGTMTLPGGATARDYILQIRGSFVGGELMNNSYEGITEFFNAKTSSFDPTDHTTAAATSNFVHNKYNNPPNAADADNSFKGDVWFDSNGEHTGTLPHLPPDSTRAWQLPSDLWVKDGTDLTTRGSIELRSGRLFSRNFAATPTSRNIYLEGNWLVRQRGVFDAAEGTVTMNGTLNANIQTDEDAGTGAQFAATPKQADFDSTTHTFTTHRNPFYNLTIDKTDAADDVYLQNSGIDGLAAHGITVLRNLNINSGVLRDNGLQIRGNNTAGSQFQMGAAGTLVLDQGIADPSAESTLPNTILASGSSFIIAAADATDPRLLGAAGMVAPAANLNTTGGQALVLRNTASGAVSDVFGQVGIVGPWNGIGKSTHNSILRRGVGTGFTTLTAPTYSLDDAAIDWDLHRSDVSTNTSIQNFQDLGTHTPPAGSGLIISEYVHDGTGSNDAVVIYNNTGGPVNLQDYALLRYNNATSAATEFPTYYPNPQVDLDIASTIIYNSGRDQRIRRLSSHTGRTTYQAGNQNYGNLYIRNEGVKFLDDGMSLIRPGVSTEGAPTGGLPVTNRTNRVRGDLMILDGAATGITRLRDNGYQFVFNPTNRVRMGQHTEFTIGKQGAFLPTHFPTLYDRANVHLVNRVDFDLDSLILLTTDTHVLSEVIYNAGGDNQTTAANDINVVTPSPTVAPQRATDADLLEAQFAAAEITYAHLTFTNPHVSGGAVTGVPLKVLNNGDISAATGGLPNPTIVRGRLTINEGNHLFDNGNQIQGTAGQQFTMATNSFFSLANDHLSLFPQNYADADLDFDANSTFIYNATDAVATAASTQKIRRLSSATMNQNYGHLIVRNGNDTRNALSYKDLAVGQPDNPVLDFRGLATPTMSPGMPYNTVVRGDLTIEEYSELRDAGYQILGNDAGTFLLDDHAVVRFGGKKDDPTFTHYSMPGSHGATQLPDSDYAVATGGPIPRGFATVNLSPRTPATVTAKVVFTSDFETTTSGFPWPYNTSMGHLQVVPTKYIYPHLTITQWTNSLYTQKYAHRRGSAPSTLTVRGNLTIAVNEANLNDNGIDNGWVSFADDNNQIIGNTVNMLYMGDNAELILSRDFANTPTNFPHVYTNAQVDLEDRSVVVYNGGHDATQNVRLLSDNARSNGNYGSVIFRGHMNRYTSYKGGRATKRLVVDANNPASTNKSPQSHVGDLSVRNLLEIRPTVDLFDNGNQISFRPTSPVGLWKMLLQRHNTRLYLGQDDYATQYPTFPSDDIYTELILPGNRPPGHGSSLTTPAGSVPTEVIYQANADQTVRNLFDGSIVGPDNHAQLNQGGYAFDRRIRYDYAGRVGTPFQRSYPHLTLRGGTKTTESSSSNLRVRGNLRIEGVPFNIHTSQSATNLYLDGDWISTGAGTFGHQQSRVHFEGYRPQDVSETPAAPAENDEEVFHHVTVNNDAGFTPHSSAAVNIMDHIRIRGNLNFVEGHIWSGNVSSFYGPTGFNPFTYFNKYPLYKTNDPTHTDYAEGIANREKEVRIIDVGTATFPATLAAASLAHSVAPVRKAGNSDFVFPIGDGGRFRPAALDFDGGIATEVVGQYFRITPGRYGFYTYHPHLESRITNVSVKEFWMLDVPHTAAKPNARVSLTWDNAYAGAVNDYPGLGVARWSNGEGKWKLVSGNLNPPSAGTFTPHPVAGGPSNNFGTVTSDIVPASFSPYTLANVTKIIDNNPLPVTLVGFKAKAEGVAVRAAWQTVTESNTKNFEVQRSTDGIHFTTVAVVSAEGNSSTLLDYAHLDKMPPAGTVYYRLKINDQDGTFDYSKVSVVHFEKSEKPTLLVYPNPSEGIDLNFDFEIPGSELEKLSVYDLTGRPVAFRILNQNERSVQVQFSQKLPTGIYIAALRAKDGSVMKEKFIVE